MSVLETTRALGKALLPSRGGLVRTTAWAVVGAVVLSTGVVFAADQILGTPNARINGLLNIYPTPSGYTAALNLRHTTDPKNGATRLYVANPQSFFHLSSYGSTAPGLLANSAGAFGKGARFMLGGDVGTPVMFFANNDFRNVNGHLAIATNGNVGVGTASPVTKFQVAGEATVDVLSIKGGSDFSEQFDVKAATDGEVKPGMVVCIDAENPGELVVSQKAYDRTVAGIVSGAGGVKPGMVMGQAGTVAHGNHPVALTGRVYCMADATQAAIQPGDMLTTSDTPGHAMKADDHERAQGAVLGKAMTGLAAGEKGLVLVLVNLQ